MKLARQSNNIVAIALMSQSKYLTICGNSNGGGKYDLRNFRVPFSVLFCDTMKSLILKSNMQIEKQEHVQQHYMSLRKRHDSLKL